MSSSGSHRFGSDEVAPVVNLRERRILLSGGRSARSQFQEEKVVSCSDVVAVRDHVITEKLQSVPTLLTRLEAAEAIRRAPRVCVGHGAQAFCARAARMRSRRTAAGSSLGFGASCSKRF